MVAAATPYNTKGQEIISDAIFEIDVKLGHQRDWLSEAQALDLIHRAGRDLAYAFGGDIMALASHRALPISFVTRDEIKKMSPEVECDGFYRPQTKDIYIASDLTPGRKRFVILHEIAHGIFTIAANGSRHGEDLANAFAGGWLEARR